MEANHGGGELHQCGVRRRQVFEPTHSSPACCQARRIGAIAQPASFTVLLYNCTMWDHEHEGRASEAPILELGDTIAELDIWGNNEHMWRWRRGRVAG